MRLKVLRATYQGRLEDPDATPAQQLEAAANYIADLEANVQRLAPDNPLLLGGVNLRPADEDDFDEDDN